MLEKKELQSLADIEALYPTIVEIWQEVFTPIIGGEDVAYMLANYQSIPVIQQEIQQGVHYFALLKDGERVGYTAYEVQADALYISKLYILQKYRGQGYMREIFAYYQELSQQMGLKQRLKVNENNQQAIRVYEHLGFTLVKKQTVEIGDGVIMHDAVYEK